MSLHTWVALLCSVFVGGLTASAAPSSKSILDKKISVNVRDLDATAAFGLLSQQAGIQITLSPEISANRVTYGAKDVTVREALDGLTSENSLEYSLEGGQAYVTRKGLPVAGGGGPSGAHIIPLKYANPQDILGKVSSVLTTNDKLIPDDISNSVVFVGSASAYEKVRSLVALFDTIPQQILIQSQIVETSQSFLRDIGFAIGDQGGKDLNGNSNTAFSDSKGPGSPNFGFKYMLGSIEGRVLDFRLTAAESRGDAKVISRPKVVTLNNKVASISSGITFHVKTLSATSSGSAGQAATAVAGGVSSINAGLSVNITPTIVGENDVKLGVSISSSSPDQGSTVDGIPGVQTNSANTTVIVKTDRTAIIAGLVKQSKSDTHNGIPYLSDIPILGYLFQSHSKSDTNNELVIFITPSILKESNPAQLYQASPAPVAGPETARAPASESHK